MTSRNQQIEKDFLREIEKTIHQEKNFELIQNMVKNNDVKTLIINKSVIDSNPVFTHDVSGEWKITNQRSSGSLCFFIKQIGCWIFAALNILRIEAIKKMNVKNFEFSQSYVAFFDRLERCNFFLEAMIDMRNEPIDNRVIQYLISQIATDGGQWDMIVSVVKKYGLVPKSVFPESFTSSKTIIFRKQLKFLLINGATQLRTCNVDEINDKKREIMKMVYRFLLLHYGTPPKEFEYRFKDKNKEIFSGTFTPIDFAKKYSNFDELDDYYLGNTVGQKVIYLNVEISELKNLVVKSIVEQKNAVFFGSDYSRSIDSQSGTMNEDVFKFFNPLYDVNYVLSKEDRLKYGYSKMTHAMIIVGVDFDEKSKKVTKFKVENSHGGKKNLHGHLVMTSKWFEEHTFQVVVKKSSLNENLRKIVEKGEIKKEFPPWDPMGALA